MTKSQEKGHRVGRNTRKLDSGSLLGFIDFFKSSRTPQFEMVLSKAITGKAMEFPSIGDKISANATSPESRAKLDAKLRAADIIRRSTTQTGYYS